MPFVQATHTLYAICSGPGEYLDYMRDAEELAGCEEPEREGEEIDCSDPFNQE